MTPLRRPVSDNRFQRAVAGDDLPATFGESLGAAFGADTLGSLVGRGMAISRANQVDGIGGADLIDPVTGERRPEAESVEARMTPPDVLTERYRELGLSFDRPMTDEAARIIADGKRAELIRADVLARGPGGLAMVPQFGAALLGAATDPLEIATALIPAVGPTRRAWLAARLGTVGGRAATGVADGLVGGLIVEPLMLALSRQQQLDYGMSDALLSIGLGGALGGAIGGAAGIVARRGEVSQRASVEAEASLAAIEGIDANPLRGTLDATPAQRRQALGVALAQTARGEPVTLDSVLRDLEPSMGTERRRFPVMQWLKSMGGIDPDGPAAEELRNLGVTNRTMPGLFRRGGMRSIDNIDADPADMWVAEGLLGLSENADGSRTYFDPAGIFSAVRDELEGAPRRTSEEAGRIAVRGGLERAIRDVREAAGDALADLTPEEEALAVRAVARDGMDPLDAVEAQIFARPEPQASVEQFPDVPFDDIQASRSADETLTRRRDDAEEAAEMQAMIDELRRAGDLAPDAEAALASVAELEAKAAASRDVSRAYAMCLAR